jgi:hypothetical protein
LVVSYLLQLRIVASVSAAKLKKEGRMATRKVVQFPVRNPALFSREIRSEMLSAGEFNQILRAAIRALPHVRDAELREDLKRALCDVLLEGDAA